MATTTALSVFDNLPTGDTHTAHEPLDQDTLPDYTPRVAHVSQQQEEREFEYKIEKKKGETLASLKVAAPAAYSKNIPTYCGVGPVKGSVDLHVKEADSITSVVVSVRGRFLPGHSDLLEHHTLFEFSNTMWPKDSDGTAASPVHSNGKLSGTYSWPFSVSIPGKIQFTRGSTGSTPESDPNGHIPPQTFMERIVTASVQYEVTLHIGRGKLKTDYSITCPFGYIPLTRPPPFPALKTIAYHERTPLLDPTVDVDGWIPAKRVSISGTLFKSHPVAIDCQLYLSAPLAYTRGSVIPLYVRMQSSDRQALDLLATHKAIKARLQRRIEYCLPMKTLKHQENLHTGKDVRDLCEAVWWPDPPQEQGESTATNAGTQMHTICLNGEIHLRHDLAPSTTFPAFTVEYYVCLYPFEDPGLKIGKIEKSLLEHPVEIVTLFAPGPRALRYAPPGYDDERPLNMEFGMALGNLGSAFM